MAPVIIPVETQPDFPARTTVAIIGGGIVGLSAALTLAERGVPVVVFEKGRIAGEQSSRNLGWIRKTNRSPKDAPMAIAADRLWAQMAARTGTDVGYRQAGIMFLSRNDKEIAANQLWLDAVRDLGIDSRLLNAAELEERVPGGCGGWAGALYTASDGYAEPTRAASAIARAAIAKGAVIVENCAVRSLLTTAGAVRGVATERGELHCDAVILAGGVWSRKFLGNLKISLPTLPVVASVIRTAPMEGPTEIAVAGPNFSFRKRRDGGFTITQRAALCAPLMLDHLKIGLRYLPTLRSNWHNLRPSLGRDFFSDLSLAGRWAAGGPSPFERARTMDPVVNQGLVAEAMASLTAAWPVFKTAQIKETWAGMIDVTPDSLPVMGAVPDLAGLTLACGFSGHGFGTSPAAGQLAADLATGAEPLVDPAPYDLRRFG